MSAAELFRNRAKARVGTMVRDKWRLDALLGIGGTAAVYAATHRNGKRVAIKILRSELTSYEEVTTRFAREGYVANKIEHPGVVSVLDDDITEDGAPFLVMELLEGHSFDRYTKGPEHALPLDRVMMMIDRVLDVLAMAHQKNVIHRDIKPANIFLCRGDEVKVLDFGIARITDSLDAAMTQTGTAIGTPGYMAPEQARGRWNEVDARTDLWAVGATMYALLIGQRPRRADTVQEELLAAMTEPMRPMADVMPSLPPTVAQYIDKSVAFDRNHRFPDALSMQQALRDIKLQLYAPPPVVSDSAVTPAITPIGMTEAPVPSQRYPGNEVTAAGPLPVPSSPHAIDFVDEVTVASAPSWQLPQDDLSGATAYPFTLPSQPVAIPVPNPTPSRSRGVWLLGGMVLLAATLAVVLFLRRPSGPAASMPLAEPPAAAAAGQGAAPRGSVATPPPETDLPSVASVATAAPPTPSASVTGKTPRPQTGGGNKPVRPPGPPKPDPEKPSDPRCKNPETAPPSCYR